MRDTVALAEDLRAAIGGLLRIVRTGDILPPGEIAILGYLDRDGPQVIADLARRRRVSHQSAAKSVSDLVERGLVRAEPYAGDRRKRLLRLTDAGSSLVNEERHRRADVLGAAIDEALTDAERAELDRCIDLLARLAARVRESSASH
ncbi:MarR family winged helix-turn-helix transcriptional regulator [Microbispora sp. NPDC049125]|uniref:MarR family winged helix-turn-helix transcriptional regulator n=1 Tax=Microbispora sp. NPDC049125 TaxID=3154929 RepID=UPI00346625A1